MRGIATTVCGTRVRSLLEAKWVSFFSLLGIPFCYEPFETPGYIPDLLLGGSALAEIRPFAWEVRDDSPIVAARDEVSAAAALHGYTPMLLGLSPSDSEAAPWDSKLSLAWELGAGDLFPAFAGVRGSVPLRELKTHDFSRLWARACARVQWKGRRA